MQGATEAAITNEGRRWWNSVRPSDQLGDRKTRMADVTLPHPVGDEQEVWRPIPSLPGYEASSLGRIRSLDRVRPLRCRWGQIVSRPYKGRIIRPKQKPNGWGGFYACFYACGGTPQVNRSVCEAFHGPAPSAKHEAAHLDGNCLNNAAANLAWATPVENAAHKKQHGTASEGSKNGAAVLSEADIVQIFVRYASGKTALEVAKEWGVSQAQISNVIRRDQWAHVSVDEALVAAAQAMARGNIARARDSSNAARVRAAAMKRGAKR